MHVRSLPDEERALLPHKQVRVLGLGGGGGGADEEVESPPSTSAEAAGAEGRGCLVLACTREGVRGAAASTARFWGCVDMVEETQDRDKMQQKNSTPQKTRLTVERMRLIHQYQGNHPNCFSPTAKQTPN